MTLSHTYYNITRAMLAVVMMGSAVSAWAEEPEPTKVAKIGDIEYETVAAAITAAGSTAATITIIHDVTENITIPESANITLDLNGYTLHTASNWYTLRNNGTLKIVDGSNGKTGTVQGSPYVFRNNATATIEAGNFCVPVGNTSASAIVIGDNSNTTISGGKFSSTQITVYVTNPTVGATVNISGGTFTTSDAAAVGGNGKDRTGEANTINISGGTFNTATASDGFIACGIYNPWKDVYNISGGTFNITGGCGILSRGGSVNITGGTFNCTGTTTGRVGDSANQIPCAAVVYDSKAGYPGMAEDSKISISGGEFKCGDNVVPVQYVAGDGQPTRIKISGGTFSELPNADLCADNYELMQNEDGTFCAATEGTAEASIGDLKYKTIATAIETAGSTETTIVLLKDPSAVISIKNGANITLTVGSVSLTKDITNAGTLNLADGSISGAISNSGTMAISGGTFSNTISATGGTINITNGTFEGTITETSPGDVAISGGTFTTLPDANCCATGYIPMKNAGSKYNMTNSLMVDDNKDISPFDDLNDENYKVATATYERITGMVAVDGSSTKYGTICLPFAITAQPDGVKVYKATSIDATTLSITEVKDFTTAIPAGTPLIFELADKAETLTVTSSNATVNTSAPVAEPTSDNLLVGTYSEKTITTGLPDIYYLNGDKFHNAYNSLSVPAYRAYLKTTTPASARPRVLSIQKDGEATGISCIEAMDDVIAVYDINGTMQNGLKHGINIIRHANGKIMKVMVK